MLFILVLLLLVLCPIRLPWPRQDHVLQVKHDIHMRCGALNAARDRVERRSGR
jgi:hypothetical protein